jgi:hypothetical protein
MRNLAWKYLRMRCSNQVTMKMVLWRPRLSLYLIRRLRSRTDPLLHPRRCAEIERKLLLRGRWLPSENFLDEYK